MAWEAFLDEKYVICISNDILSEYIEILTRKVSYVFAIRIANVLLKSNCVKFFDPHYHFELISQDYDDNKFVDCAIIANADFLVSDDNHFNVLKNITFPKVNIIKLDHFISELTQMSSSTT